MNSTFKKTTRTLTLMTWWRTLQLHICPIQTDASSLYCFRGCFFAVNIHVTALIY